MILTLKRGVRSWLAFFRIGALRRKFSGLMSNLLKEIRLICALGQRPLKIGGIALKLSVASAASMFAPHQMCL